MIEAFILLYLTSILIVLVFLLRKKLEPVVKVNIPQLENKDFKHIPIGASTCSHDWEEASKEILEAENQKKVIIILKCHRCGLIDKTIECTDKILPIDKKTCNHTWVETSKEILDIDHQKKLIIISKCNICGLVDKTVECTDKPAPPPPPPKEPVDPSLICSHKWIKEKSIVCHSAYEQIARGNKPVNKNNKTPPLWVDGKLEVELFGAKKWMFRKSIAEVYICRNCGKIEKVITSNFDDETETEEEV